MLITKNIASEGKLVLPPEIAFLEDQLTYLQFIPNGHLTLGVELEIQLIDSLNLDLSPRALEIVKQAGPESKIKPEIFQSMVEVNTGICENVDVVASDLTKSVSELYQLCRNLGISCSTTGTHPFAQYRQRLLFPSDRYNDLIDRNQWIAQRLSIFGLHVHLGMKSKEECISFMNFFQHFLPHLVVLSASSPFWQGQNTGLASSRLTVFEASPTSGHCQWQHSWESFEEQYFSLMRCGAINSTKDLWWDLRPSPHFGTLEIRVCDGTATLQELLGIIAFIHGLAHWFNDLSPAEREISPFVQPLPLWLIRENKWRALRYGLDMQLITTTEGKTRPIKDAILEMLQSLQQVFGRLSYQKYDQYLRDIVTFGNSADRQQHCFSSSQDFHTVTKMNVLEFEKSFIHNIACI